MSEIYIERRHTIGLDEVKRRFSEVEAKIRDRFGVDMQWNGNQATFKTSGASGTVALGQEHVAIQVQLGLMFRPMSGKLKEAVERHLDKALVA